MDIQAEADLLRKIPVFSKLEPSKLKLLAFTSQSLIFEDTELLFRVGESADSAYVIVEGEVEIVSETESGDFVVGVLGQNEIVGELGVLTNSPRSATIRARGRAVALRISDEMFLRLLAENPEVALDVMRQLSDKLVKSLRQYEELRERFDASA